MVGVFLKCKSKTHICCSKNLTIFIPAVNSSNKWEDFKHVMKNPAWPEFQPYFNSKNPVDPILAGFLKSRSGTPLAFIEKFLSKGCSYRL